MNVHHLILAVGLAAAIAGCSAEDGKAQGEARVEKVERSVDWQAAQKDAAKQNPPMAATSPKSGFNPAVTTAAVGAPVPMLAPPTSASIASGLNDSGATARVTPDGYFITVPGPRYDVTVHGSKDFYLAPQAAGRAKQPAAAEAPGGYRYEQGEGEVVLTFSRYGADYMITFACKTGSPDVACINRTDAVAFAERLQIVGQ